MTDEDVKNALERLKTLQDEKNKVPKTYLILNHYQLEELEKIINENYITKEKIREYAKSIVDDDLYKMNCCYNVNGTQVRRDLEELLKW